MKVQVDTNVVLDIALNREPFHADAVQLLKISSQRQIQLYLTATTITDLYYIIRRAKGHDLALGFLRDLLAVFGIVAVDRRVIIEALESSVSDFEDAVQCASAEAEGIETIVTRNEADFTESGLAIVSPSAFLESLG